MFILSAIVVCIRIDESGLPGSIPLDAGTDVVVRALASDRNSGIGLVVGYSAHVARSSDGSRLDRSAGIQKVVRFRTTRSYEIFALRCDDVGSRPRDPSLGRTCVEADSVSLSREHQRFGLLRTWLSSFGKYRVPAALMESEPS